jgi:mannose-6-phosphate isomerase-like protein (cupin superfamily)
MKSLSRRDLVSALPALALPPLTLFGPALTAFAQASAKDTIPAHCATFNFSDLPKSVNATTGNITRAVMQGTLPTGEYIEMHETMLAPGQMPHPAHHHVHSELMLIREGTVEFQMGDHASVVTAGGVLYARSGEMHGLKNVGSTPANYFVIAIGKEPA